MIYLLHGEETYLSRLKLKEITVMYFKKHKGLNFFNFDFSKDVDSGRGLFENFKNALIGSSLFLDKKLIVLKNTFDDKKNFKKIIDFFEEKNIAGDKNIIIALWENKKVKDDDLSGFKIGVKTQEFKKMTPSELKEFVKKECSLLGAVIEVAAIEALIDLSKGNLSMIKNELGKLSAYNKKIIKENIDLLSFSQIELNIFELTDSLASGNRRQALNFFEKLVKNGESESYLLSMFAYTVRNLIQAKNTGIEEGGYKKNSYGLMKIRTFAGRFSADKLAAIHKDLFDIDIVLKTGTMSSKALFTKLIINF